MPLTRKTIHDQIYGDVSAKSVLARSEPFFPGEPKYKIRDEDGILIDYGEIAGAKKVPKYFRTDPILMNSNLNSKDIHGNVPGTRLLGNFHNRERR